MEVAEEQVTTYEAEFHALGTMDHLTDERTRLQSELRGNKVKLGEYTVRSFLGLSDVSVC